ncbi:DNA recombination protein RmuC [Candidatus Microgenomates bacterium]|nr:DNA recombination protein RmuC [Candidatus Microgenomates bacterium]
MGNEIYLLLALVLLTFAGLAFWLNKKISQIGEKNGPNEELLEWLKSTSARMDDQNKVFSQSIALSTKSLNERLDNAARVISQVQKNIGEMSEIGRGMKDIQEFLRSPKLRGNIGEQVLKELLGQMLPKQSFHLQYSFKSGAMVDAAIKTAAGIIPVDSKFPMENFRKMASAEDEAEKKIVEKEFVRDVKKHVDDISKKYILTEEGTIDYALMYIPSETIYYEIINNADLFDYAGKKGVLPVSPMTFYAYMKAILMSFEGQKIESRARAILAAIRAIQKDYNKVDENLGVLGRHIQNAYNQMSNVASGFTMLGQKLTSTQSLGESVADEEISQLETVKD